MLSLKDKVAFISGAGSVGDDPDAKVWGNGKATAVLLARQGAKIYGADLRKDAADDTNGIIEPRRRNLRSPRGRYDEGVRGQSGRRRMREQFGRIDILVNNVGGSAPGDAVTMTEEAWDRQISHNLKTVFLACKHVLPVMEKQGERRDRQSLLDRWTAHDPDGPMSPTSRPNSASSPSRNRRPSRTRKKASAATRWSPA